MRGRSGAACQCPSQSRGIICTLVSHVKDPGHYFTGKGALGESAGTSRSNPNSLHALFNLSFSLMVIRAYRSQFRTVSLFTPTALSNSLLFPSGDHGKPVPRAEKP